jgi:hypothetical protein
VSQGKVQLAPLPPYSTERASSNFSLFDHLQRKLRGSLLQTAKELLAEVRKLMGEISPETLLDVFHDWIAWCESVIASDGTTLKKLSNGDVCFA